MLRPEQMVAIGNWLMLISYSAKREVPAHRDSCHPPAAQPWPAALCCRRPGSLPPAVWRPLPPAHWLACQPPTLRPALP